MMLYQISHKNFFTKAVLAILEGENSKKILTPNYQIGVVTARALFVFHRGQKILQNKHNKWDPKTIPFVILHKIDV